MCGVFGVFSPGPGPTAAEIERAHRVQRHRGPDGSGHWTGQVGHYSACLGHQRLAIIDLSDAGRQPMRSVGSDCWLVFNGELYNHLELRDELRACGFEFRTRTDTEVVLNSVLKWGAEEAMRRFNGMWAFAFLDPAGQRLILSRDRAGEKPLYYSLGNDGALRFASEIKTLLAMTGQRYRLNLGTISSFLLQSLVDADDQSVFQGIQQLRAGHLAVVDLAASRISFQSKPYWRWAPTMGEHGLGERAAVELLGFLFRDAVRIRLRSDVPVGVLLSGGLDSSAIAAVAVEEQDRTHPVVLLGGTSGNPRFDESPFISLMGAHLETPVSTVKLHVDAGNAVTLLERASHFHESPVPSFSHVAHMLLMERAAELGVKVILSGQGADELLCGYKKYVGFYAQSLAREGRFMSALELLWGFTKNRSIIPQFSIAEARRYLPQRRGRDVRDTRGEALASFGRLELGLGSGSLAERQYRDLSELSVPALTHKEDRMSMAYGREIRLPFLDSRLIELLLGLPPERKLASGWTKHVFRQAMGGSLPLAIAWRRDKRGFVNPQEEWLRGPLRQIVREHVGPGSLIARHGLVDHERLRRLFDLYCTDSRLGRQVWYRDVFAPFSLEVWLRQIAQCIEW